MQVIISGVECSCAFVFTILYISRVRRHNRTEVAPDAQLYLQSALYTAPDASFRSTLTFLLPITCPDSLLMTKKPMSPVNQNRHQMKFEQSI